MLQTEKVMISVMDPSKANKELRWGSTTMFADGIKLTIHTIKSIWIG